MVHVVSAWFMCRPVDCYTKVPLDYLPGYINETIYGDNIESGWAWYPYQQNNKQLQVHLAPYAHTQTARSRNDTPFQHCQLMCIYLSYI